MRTWRVRALTVLLGWCAVQSAARADDGQAALLPMQGPQAAKVRQRVQKGLRDADVNLVPLKKATAVARKTKSFAARASRLDAEIMVGGRIRRAGDRWIADVGIRNERGKRVEKFRTGASTLTRLSNRIVSKLLDTRRMPIAGAAEEGVQKLDVGAAAAATDEPDVPKLVVRPFKGTQGSKIRGAAVRGLKERPVELVPNNRFAREAQRLNVDLAAPEGHVLPARSMGVNAIVEGDVFSEDGFWSAYVRLVDGRSADVIAQHYYEGDSASELAAAVQAEIWDDFHKDVGRLEPRAAVAVAPAAARPPPKTKVETAREPKKRSKKDRPAAVDIEFGFKFVHRSLSWNDVVVAPRDYTLGFGPGIQTKFQWYPGAHFTSGVGAQFGVEFEYERLFDFDSTRDEGGTMLSFPTSSQQFLVGARWRYPVGRWEPRVIVDYGVHQFDLAVSQDPVATPGLPSVEYKFVRAGAGFRVAAGKKENFIVVLDGAFRALLSSGGLESDQFFPQSSGNGMDVLVMFGYGLPKGFELRLGLDYRRYWFDLNPAPPPPEPPFVAGGALDQYWGLSIGAAWRY